MDSLCNIFFTLEVIKITKKRYFKGIFVIFGALFHFLNLVVLFVSFSFEKLWV
ncbi:hypothetical protein RV14_GL002258 [Enterococcus ratti]|uniref:Uncharacterized protein n=1 Tax=Enterococcus ratti TaxID=150033 RepID=A0A1L8WNT7_9ENTE|nr:hypothetical protein RV14_GL002258 [Enterococcus ratti]